jgi:hypothetical protein
MFVPNSKLIYVACPYGHPDKEIVEHRMSVVTEYLAKLSYEGKIAFSPLLMHYCLDKKFALPKDYEFWRLHSLTLLSKSDILHVLGLPGWNQSVGVLNEIEFAKKNSLPIDYINPYYKESGLSVEI